MEGSRATADTIAGLDAIAKRPLTISRVARRPAKAQSKPSAHD
jgi:hypothetical protein